MQTRPSESGTGHALHEAAWTAGAGLLVVLFGLMLLARDPYAFWNDDFQSYHLPGYRDMARAWQDGEFPLLSPYSWIGGALAGEYQYGVFSVCINACAVGAFALNWSLPNTAALFSLFHLAILASGAFRLGRSRGLAPHAAMVVALTASLNGWIIIWGAKSWCVALASFAWLPWFWGSIERAAARERGPARFVPAALFLYLILTAGWPFTVLMAALLSLWLTLTIRREHSSWRAVWPLAAAWVFGLALSAPAWLALLEYTPHTLRAQLRGDPSQWRVPVSGLMGLVLPSWVTEWPVYDSRKDHQCIELAGGLVPLVLLLAACRSLGLSFIRRHLLLFALAVLALELVLLPSLGMFRWSFRWLPLFFLVLGVLAGHAVQELDSPQRPNLGFWCIALVVLAALPAWFTGMEPPAHVTCEILGLLALALAWLAIERGPCWRVGLRLRRWMPCLVLLGSTGLAYWDASRFAEVISWKHDQPLDQTAPLDAARCYFTVHDYRDISDWDDPLGVTTWNHGTGAALRPGNTWMLIGIRSINGYSPMVPAALQDVFRFMSYTRAEPQDAEDVLQRWSGPEGFLQFVGVDGLIVATRYAAQTRGLEQRGWDLVAQVEGGAVYHRQGPLAPRVRSVPCAVLADDHRAGLVHLRGEDGLHTPVLLRQEGDERNGSLTLTFATARADLVHEGRNAVTVEVHNPSPDQEALIVFPRPWFPGYRASLNGTALPVITADLTMPAVRLPPGAHGVLLLKYQPASLVLGCWLAGAALLGMGLVGGISVARVRT